MLLLKQHIQRLCNNHVQYSSPRGPSASRKVYLYRQIVAPHFLGNLHLQPDLRPLLLHRQIVALHRTAETALVRQAQLVQALGAVSRGLLQPADDLCLVVQLGCLAAHHAQHHDLVVRQVPQRAEVAGPRVIVLEEVDIDVELLEQRLGDGLVPALREPLRAVVAAAEVNADGHVLGPLGDGAVDEVRVLLGERARVLAVAAGRLLAHALVAQVREVGVVELDEAAPGRVQVGNLLLVHALEVLEEGLESRVGALVDGLAAAAEVHHGRRGDANLGGDLARLAGLLDLLGQEVVVVHLNGAGVAQLSGDHEARRGFHAHFGDVG